MDYLKKKKIINSVAPVTQEVLVAVTVAKGASALPG